VKDKVTPEDINRWMEKLEPLLPRIEALDAKGEELLTNLKAYADDARHFQEDGNLVLAFECMVWAWALWETGRQLGVLTE
jgi:hypothetical protein